MRKRSKWWVLVLGCTAAFFILRGGNRPDDRVAKRLSGLCAIADANVKTPSRGVDKLFAFFAANTPDLMRDFGALLVEIEGIDNDAKHDARAREASRRMRAPLIACAPALQRFGNAIAEDGEASVKLHNAVERLGRTLELIFDANDLRTAVPFLANPTLVR